YVSPLKKRGVRIMADRAGLEPHRARSRWAAAIWNARKSLRQAERALLHRLTGSRLYRAASYARSAMWIVPFIAVVLVLALAPVIRVLDAWPAWRFFGLGGAGA